MPASVRHAGRLALLILALLGAVRLPPTSDVAPVQPDEVRALWVLRTTLTSPQAVDAMVRTAAANRFNTLLVQVRGRGDAYFNGGVEPRAAALALQAPDFDPLQSVLSAAREHGLRVHAWINVNLVASAGNLPASRGHIIYRHPEWLMVPREIADEMANLEPQSPAYVGTLARWTRANLDEVEGLYLSPLTVEAGAYTASMVADLVDRYSIDGVHLDYARFPNDSFDYSRSAMTEMRNAVASRLDPLERLRLDARAAVRVTTYGDRFRDRWAAFRRSRMTSLVMRLRTVVKARRPEAIFSAAVVPDETEAADRRLQDWRTWLDSGLLDVACPMAYTQDPETFIDQIAAVRAIAGARGVWAGIGAYRLTPDQTVENIFAARRVNADGVVLFSYDSLTNPAQHRFDYLAQVAQAAFGLPGPAPGAR